MLSPYFLQYAGRISVILLPWAGLPWLVAFAAMALRRKGWRYPALFAVLVALVSGINASSIIYVGVAPVLFIIYAVTVEHQTTWRRAFGVIFRIGLLTSLVCLWWIIGLQIEAAYGVNVLRTTETVPSTSATANPSEVIRGLGYWYFYGGDRLGPWTSSSVLYTQQLWLLAMTYVLPVLAFLSAAFVRWRHRAYFILLVVVGLVLSVGAFPYDSPTPFGGVLKAFMNDTTAGLAMRSTDRATPLVVLGLAMLVGTGVAAAWRRIHWVGVVVGIVVWGLAIANNPALFNGDTIANDFSQPAKLPAPEMQAINHLNATHAGTRVLAIPGNDFSSYRWGNTVDTPQPAYLNRPFVTREQQVMGSIATADTLYALDDPIQENVENFNALAPMARLVSAGDLLVENDQQYEHFGIPQPQQVAQQLTTTPTGLSHKVSYGTPVPNVSGISTLDEQDLAGPANVTWPAPLVSYTVNNPRPITRAESNQGALVVSGDATALQDLAGAGLLDTKSAIYYSGTLDSQPKQLQQLMAGGAALVVTDTNRKQAFRWDSVSANAGYTETPGENPQKTDPSDSPVDLFPKAPADARTTAYDVGAVNVTASTYGNSVSYTPEDRAFSAVDSNLDTAWRTGAFISDPKGQWWQLAFAHPVTTNQVTLVQPQRGDLSRHITRATLTFDGHNPLTVNLGAASQAASGQVVPIGNRTFHTMRITIESTSNNTAPPPTAAAVGFAEVQIPGQHITEVVKMPTDLLKATGAASRAHRLTLVMTRDRTSQYPPRSDPETDMIRQFTLPTTRTFTVSGQAGISALVPDDVIDRMVGRSGGTIVAAYSQGRMPGDLLSGAQAAADGNPATVWQPGFGNHQLNEWLVYDLHAPTTFDHMNLQVVADGRHSVPTSLTISTPSGTRHVTLPPIADSSTPGATVTVPVTFPALTGSHIQVTITGVRFEYTTNYYSPSPIALPLGIAEVGIPGVSSGTVPATLPATCQTGLMTIDGHPVDLRAVGSTAAALSDGDVSIEPCGPDARGITLGPGPHVVATALGHTAGWDVDQLVLDSAPGGGPGPQPSAAGLLPATQAGSAPTVKVGAQGPTSIHATVHGVTGAFALVLGQSIDKGWKAVAQPGRGAPSGARSVDLGRPSLIDGFANGWTVSNHQLATLGALGGAGSTSFTVSLTWTPQKEVWAALAVSAAALATCVVLAVYPRRRLRPARVRTRHRARHAAGASAREETETLDSAETAVPAAAGPPYEVAADDLPAVAPDRSPSLSWPFSRIGGRPRWWTIVLVSLFTGGLAAAIASPIIGAAALVATALALVVPQLRGVVSLAALGLLVAAAVSVVHGQVVHPLPESSDWPGAYRPAGTLVWIAVVLLGVDGVVESARRVAKRQPAAEQPGEPHPE
jgi:hypothetical protein